MLSAAQRSLKSNANSDLSLTLRQFAGAHRAFDHPLFRALESVQFSPAAAGHLLKNYDAHASHLRRLLLKSATIMPESAVAFILENVRNEYGNGVNSDRHQLQLQSVALQAGNSASAYRAFTVEKGVKSFIKEVTPFYYPLKLATSLSKAAIAAGAITATELMAVEEFKALQIAFKQFGLQDHIWFDHVMVEQEHSDDSIALALYFLERGHFDAVEFGLSSVLDANMHLYDGLLATIV